MAQEDPFNLKRFVEAQASTYNYALAEITAGAKQSHWMWFVFPQLKGLGRSSTAQYFGIVSIDEAKAYVAHTLLGPRLHEITRVALDASAPSLRALFGTPDDMKFRSSMTLFEKAAGDPDSVFSHALNRWCQGERDTATLEALQAQ